MQLYECLGLLSIVEMLVFLIFAQRLKNRKALLTLSAIVILLSTLVYLILVPVRMNIRVDLLVIVPLGLLTAMKWLTVLKKSGGQG